MFNDKINPIRLRLELDKRWIGWYSWDWDTVAESYLRETGHLPTEPIQNKIHALKVLSTEVGLSNFLNDAVVFEKTALGLNGESVVFDIYQDIAPSEIFFALDIANDLVPDMISKLGDKVKNYIATMLVKNGVLVSPPKWNFLQPYINKLCKVPLNESTIAKILSKFELLKNNIPNRYFEETQNDIQVSKLIIINDLIKDKFLEKEQEI